MKTILSFTAGLMGLWSSNTWSAATISLNNYDSGNPIFLFSDTLLPAKGSYVQLISMGGGPVVPASGESSIIPLTEDGFFFGGVGVVFGVADYSTAEFTLRAWTAGNTFDDAMYKGSISWSQQTGGWNPNAVPPAPPMGPSLANPVFIMLPEPSTIALGVIGGAAMLLPRRKR